MFYDDLISEVLVKLPVKSLLRFKSVSKSWLSLISNPNFIKSHLRLAIAKPESNQTLVIREDKEDDTLIVLLDLNSREVVADLNFPYSKGEVPSPCSSFVVGSACGIVCVCVDMQSPDSYVHDSNFRELINIYLWNPATKQSKLIPPYTIPHDKINYVSIGFGYDPIGDDFKVVLVSSASSAKSAEIYSTNRNAWRKVDPDPIDIPCDDMFGCCINGYVCGIGTHGMMVFDLNKEVLTCGFRFPITSYLDVCITNYDDRIGVIMWWEKEEDDSGSETEESRIVKLWTLDDEACLCDSGVKASWTLKLSVEIDLMFSFVYGYFNGDILLMDEGSWALYNCESKEEKYIPGPSDLSDFFKYTESLVSIEGSKQVSWDGD